MTDLFDDPIEETPVVEETPEVPESVWNETPKEIATVTAVDGNKVRVTLKGGSSYAAPWITVDGTDIPDALAQLENNADELKKLVELTAKVGKYFSGTEQPQARPAQGGQAQAAPQQKTPPQNAAPNGETHVCRCGEQMKFLSGFSAKSNKAYSFFACPKPQGQQCQGDNGRSYTVNYKG